MHYTEHPKTLILDADMAPALSILRSLATKNIACDIASAIATPINRFSRYAKQHYQYPDPLTQSGEFVDFIIGLLQDRAYELIIPVTERSLIPLAGSSRLDPWRDRLAIADFAALQQVLYKTRTLHLATQCQIPLPFSYSVNNLADIENLLPKLSYPVVLKPGQSIPNAESRRQLSVTYAHDDQELFKLANTLLPRCSLILQQYVQGIGAGIELLADHGDIVYAFQHQRLHELPLTGGGSCYRKSVAVNPVLLAASKKIIKALNWHGVAMVEFKWQPATSEYWLMEINGRFWGSLPLACAAGADFPYLLYQLWVHKQRPQNTHYRQNIYCRKLSADIYWYEQVLRRNGDKRLVNFPSHKSLLKDLLFILHPTRHFFDIQCWSDPVPGIIDVLDFIQSQYLRVYERLRYKWLLRWHSSSFVSKQLQNRIRKAKRILFLCYGNINRSALAERIAQQQGLTNIEFCSAGFHSIDHRPADPNMVSVAKQHDIDLTKWQSNTLNTALVESCDLILAMEISHLHRLYADYPQARSKSFLLGSLLNPSTEVEIPDPYNKQLDVYLFVFNTINAALEKINVIKTK